MPTLQEIEKKLRREYEQYSKNPANEESQVKLNGLFYNSILSIISELKSSKNKTNPGKTFDNKIPRKRNPYETR